MVHRDKEKIFFCIFQCLTFPMCDITQNNNYCKFSKVFITISGSSNSKNI